MLYLHNKQLFPGANCDSIFSLNISYSNRASHIYFTHTLKRKKGFARINISSHFKACALPEANLDTSIGSAIVNGSFKEEHGIKRSTSRLLTYCYL